MKRFLTAGLIGAMAIAGFTGCQTADSMYESTTGVFNPDKVQLQGQVKWMSPPSNMGLRQVPPKNMAVYLRVKNSSGTPLPDLYGKIATQLQQAGYNLTRNIDEAHFTLLADTRYYGVNKQKDAGGSMLTGAAIGGASGAIIGHNVGDDNRDVGAASGAVLGAAAGNILANRNKMTEINLVVDLRVGERIEGGVKTTRSSDASAGVSHSDRFLSEGGHGHAGNQERQTVVQQDDFLFHSNRVVAYAKRMNLTSDQALPFLSERLSLAVGSVLP